MYLNNNKVQFTTVIQNLTKFLLKERVLKNHSIFSGDASKQNFNGERPKNVFEEASKEKLLL